MVHGELVLIDFPNLKKIDEINRYIKSQLLNHFPAPDRLIYDYIVSGKKALLFYMLRENYLEYQGKVLHPFLIFKSLLKKDGSYRIYYHNEVIDLKIKNRNFYTLSIYSVTDNLPKLLDPIVVTDRANLDTFDTPPQERLLILEDLYKISRGKLFNKKRQSRLNLLFPTVMLLGISLSVYTLIDKTDRSFKALKELESKYNKIIQTTSGESSELYQNKLDKILSLESNIPPNIYSIFYELNSNSNNYKVLNFTYNNRFLSIVAITPNSLDLVDSLNRSTIFKFKLNSTVREKLYEQVNFSGEVICP
ncbi:hypothetical protein EW093_10200 [Thiospirochaeta perfilievii]|uniref:Uncharacterized protein n=1 Tax=Thiospirochaeta perfilievii TaxID=252967 RepID=A0A5C1QEC3_9SPIO|nr:hypothetical protein [Thiospirochaeta perfilievii]QEN05064.1 hypothetical protein EW093_10200 [Thiospirochaeta perfilievii]